MVDTEPRRLTARGAATRARIIDAAADLMYFRGVGSTTLDDVLAASGTSKSQLYQHFADKDALVQEVVALQGRLVLERNRHLLEKLNSFRGLELWRDAVLQKVGLHQGAYGCELGALAGELADTDEAARVVLATDVQAWESLISSGLRRMQERGVLVGTADPDQLATGLLAAVQGGYLLAQLSRTSAPMLAALDMALAHIRTFAADPADQKRTRKSR